MQKQMCVVWQGFGGQEGLEKVPGNSYKCARDATQARDGALEGFMNVHKKCCID